MHPALEEGVGLLDHCGQSPRRRDHQSAPAEGALFEHSVIVVSKPTQQTQPSGGVLRLPSFIEVRTVAEMRVADVGPHVLPLGRLNELRRLPALAGVALQGERRQRMEHHIAQDAGLFGQGHTHPAHAVGPRVVERIRKHGDVVLVGQAQHLGQHATARRAVLGHAQVHHRDPGAWRGGRCLLQGSHASLSCFSSTGAIPTRMRAPVISPPAPSRGS